MKGLVVLGLLGLTGVGIWLLTKEQEVPTPTGGFTGTFSISDMIRGSR